MPITIENMRVAIVVDAFLRRRVLEDAGPVEPPHRVGRSELAEVLLALLQTVSEDQSLVVADLAMDAPLSVDPLHVWMSTDADNLAEIVDLHGASRTHDNAVNQLGFVLSDDDVDAEQELHDRVSERIARFYADIGIDYEREQARNDVGRAINSIRFRTERR